MAQDWRDIRAPSQSLELEGAAGELGQGLASRRTQVEENDALYQTSIHRSLAPRLEALRVEFLPSRGLDIGARIEGGEQEQHLRVQLGNDKPHPAAQRRPRGGTLRVAYPADPGELQHPQHYD